MVSTNLSLLVACSCSPGVNLLALVNVGVPPYRSRQLEFGSVGGHVEVPRREDVGHVLLQRRHSLLRAGRRFSRQDADEFLHAVVAVFNAGLKVRTA